MTLATEGRNIIETTITGGLAAAAVASSAALIFIPNVETITLFVFLMGIVLSTRQALIGAVTTAILFEFVATAVYSPSGFTFYLKLVSWLLVVILGIATRSEFRKFRDPAQNVSLFDRLMLYGLGAFTAFLFDSITNIGMLLFLPSSGNSIIVAYFAIFLAGILFTITHVVSNSLLFLVIPELVELYYQITKGLNLNSQALKSE